MSSGSGKVGFSVFWVLEGRFQCPLGLGKVSFSVFWVLEGRFLCLLGPGG